METDVRYYISLEIMSYENVYAGPESFLIEGRPWNYWQSLSVMAVVCLSQEVFRKRLDKQLIGEIREREIIKKSAMGFPEVSSSYYCAVLHLLSICCNVSSILGWPMQWKSCTAVGKLLDHLHMARYRPLEVKMPRNSYWMWLSRMDELREDGVHCWKNNSSHFSSGYIWYFDLFCLTGDPLTQRWWWG